MENISNSDDENWDDWTDNEEEAICLFCDKKDVPSNIFSHMTQEHNFNFTKLRLRETQTENEIELVRKLHKAEEKLKKMEQAFNDYKDSVKRTFFDKLDTLKKNDNNNIPIIASTSNNNELPPELEPTKNIDSDSDHENIDTEFANNDFYFTSYDNSDIHIQMLQVSCRFHK
ncbi:hypothetical protein BCR36DRAFT_394252 [Piromyces finnis]|uniref:Uncharacterized protein n=1 Tax=Piromyces finnis TaxID=1754191 RepID=A0A1Y1VQJ7_9FUNG|nr:hypothetical protein BCR36DRAFT_394252 [Piromyces finnis]|eukprot:ORX61131.1 hypothetical protein BCR36DRAFT_394252 [Piromyces finnis]